jgi:hypothetical protein
MRRKILGGSIGHGHGHGHGAAGRTKAPQRGAFVRPAACTVIVGSEHIGRAGSASRFPTGQYVDRGGAGSYDAKLQSSTRPFSRRRSLRAVLAMNRTVRQITCRQDLWARVDALAKRRGISADDVVQAALVQLFSKKKANSESSAGTRGLPPPSPGSSASRLPSKPGLPRPPGAKLPPPTARPTAPAGPRSLFLYYDGQVFEVNQDEFVIGRGSKYSDLAIKDANISRRHCAVVRRSGQYYMKDLESTNGIEFNGQRVDNHLIQEGTTYKLCDHEIRFSFLPPS